MSRDEEIMNFREVVRLHGAKTLRFLLSAMLVWLFGVLVFIPISSTVGWQTELICTLIFLVAFSVLVSGAISGVKIFIDAFSVFPARKYLIKRRLTKNDAVVVSKQLLYILSTVTIYLLYFPFLVRLHPAFSGIFLILVVIFVFFLSLKALLTSRKAITQWLFS
jgi:hypothetical protein